MLTQIGLFEPSITENRELPTVSGAGGKPGGDGVQKMGPKKPISLLTSSSSSLLRQAHHGEPR